MRKELILMPLMIFAIILAGCGQKEGSGTDKAVQGGNSGAQSGIAPASPSDGTDIGTGISAAESDEKDLNDKDIEDMDSTFAEFENI